MLAEDVRRTLRTFPDFPTEGILFQDVAPVFGDPELLRRVVRELAEPWRGRVDAVAGIESRGFILGAPVAMELHARFVPIRKKGKLPGRVLHEDYDLEYGRATVEMQADALRADERVLLVDDVLATGGTANAAVKLVEKAGARVAGHAFLLEIGALHGRAKLARESQVIATV